MFQVVGEIFAAKSVKEPWWKSKWQASTTTQHRNLIDNTPVMRSIFHIKKRTCSGKQGPDSRCVCNSSYLLSVFWLVVFQEVWAIFAAKSVKEPWWKSKWQAGKTTQHKNLIDNHLSSGPFFILKNGLVQVNRDQTAGVYATVPIFCLCSGLLCSKK